MKYIIIIIISLINLPIIIYGQNDYHNNLVKINMNYLYYFLGGNTNNNFNYELSIVYGRTVNNLEINLGLSYSTKNYFYIVNSSQTWNELNKREYKLSYFNFPFIIYFNLFKKGKIQLSLSSGIIFNKVIKYSIISYYNNAPTLHESISNLGNLGISFRSGIGIKEKIFNDLLLNLGPFTDIKLISNNPSENNSYYDLPDNIFTIGLNICIEYSF